MDGIEIFDNGVAGFVSRREPAWHSLGNVVYDENVDTISAMREAGLTDWNVRVDEIPLPDGYQSDKPLLVTVRDRPFSPGKIDVFGPVGSRYVPFQNEQTAEFGDALHGEGAVLETVGSLHGGRQMFYTMKIDRTLLLDPSGSADQTDLYLIVANSHDGSKAIQAMISPVRVVCANTLNFAINQAQQSFKIRHTRNAGGRVDEARKALGIVGAYFDEFEVMARELFETKVTNDTFEQIVQALYPLDNDASKAAVTRQANKIESIESIWQSDANAPIFGTGWGAVNALTEWLDYGRNAHTEESNAVKASGFDLVTNKERQRMLSVVKAFA